MTDVPPPGSQGGRPVSRRAELISCLTLLAGILVAGLAGRAVGLDTGSLPIAIVVVAVGVFLGVGLRKPFLGR